MANVLMKLNKSRKAFLVEYACGLILLAFLLVMDIRQVVVPGFVRTGMISVATVAIVSPEIMRYLTRYKITTTKLIITKGLLKQSKKNVYYHPLAFVPDLNIRQGRMDRILGIGTVFLKGGVENTFELDSVNKPHKVVALIEKLIDDNKKLKDIHDGDD